MTRHTRSLGWVVAFSAFCVAAPTAMVKAHHSFAMYDQTTTKTTSGTLVRLIPGGSHSQIVFDLIDAEGKPAVGPDGKPQKWQVEIGSATNIARQGVTVKTLPPGTVITVTLLCATQRGEPGGDCRSAGALWDDDASRWVHASDWHRDEAARQLDGRL